MLTSPSNEQSLLAQLAKGDELAFRELYEAYQQRIFGFALYLTKNRDVAEDTVQEVFASLWEKRTSVNSELPILPYIKKITQNHVLNLYRAASRNHALLDKIHAGLAAIQSETIEKLLEKELRKAYKDAVASLPPQQRIVFTLHRDEELTYDQIAERLGLSRNTVRNHMGEAIRSVRNHVGNHTDLAVALIAAILWESHP